MSPWLARSNLLRKEIMTVIDFGVIMYAMEITILMYMNVPPSFHLNLFCYQIYAGLRLTADHDLIYSPLTFIVLPKIDNRLEPVGGEICR